MDPTSEASSPLPRWEVWLFLALALLSLLPFWSVQYLPTTDGPSHLYNAWLLRELASGAAPPALTSHFQIDLRPLPNWLTHGSLALLLGALPPLAAEKVLASAYVLLFLGGLWALVGAVRPGSRWPAFLGFPFLYHYLFQFGFYNFSLSLGLFFLVVAVWWRNRDSPTLALGVKLNLLLWLCWFAHILSLVLALFAIGVLWLATLRRDNLRRHLPHVALLAPQVMLPLWFLSVQGGETVHSGWTLPALASYFFRLGALATFSRWQIVAATLLVLLFLVLLLVTLRREGWRGEPFLLLAGVFLVLYFVSPEGVAGGTMLKPRLSLYPYLVAIPWFTRRLERRAIRVLVLALTVAALANVAFQLRWYRQLSAEVARYVHGLDGVERGARLLPLTFDAKGPAGLIGIFGHAADHAARERGLIDWDDYEAASTLFPVRFRAGLHRPDIYSIEARPAAFPLASYVDAVDYVYAWGMPEGTLLEAPLAESYQLIAADGPGRLYRRRADARLDHLPPEPPHPRYPFEAHRAPGAPGEHR
jgi:hypothetical protein